MTTAPIPVSHSTKFTPEFLWLKARYIEHSRGDQQLLWTKSKNDRKEKLFASKTVLFLTFIKYLNMPIAVFFQLQQRSLWVAFIYSEKIIFKTFLKEKIHSGEFKQVSKIRSSDILGLRVQSGYFCLITLVIKSQMHINPFDLNYISI